MTKTLKCHGCGSVKETNKNPKEFVCKNCGAVNMVPEGDGTSLAPLGCTPPKGFEWTLPSGKQTDPSGKTIYVTAQGSMMSKKEFIETFGCDPDIMLRKMREMGVKGVKGYKNLSTLGKLKV